MFQFLKRIGRNWWIYLVILLLSGIRIYMDFLIPQFLSKLIADLQAGGTNLAGTVCIDSLWIILVALVSGIASILTTKVASTATAMIVSKSRYEMYKRIGDFSSDEMNKYSVSSLVTRTTNDITFAENTLNLFFRFIIYGPGIAIAALILLLSGGVWELLLAVLGGVILLVVLMIVLVKVALPKYRAIQAKLDKVTLVSRENLEGLRVVRAYNAETFQEEKFDRVNVDLEKTERFSNRCLGILEPGINLIIGLMMVAIYAVGSYIVPAGRIQYAQLSAVIQYAALILVGFIMMTVLIVQLPRAIVCMNRVNEIINTVPVIQGKEQTPASDEVGTIEFKNVTYRYAGAEKPVIENISFKVKKGETIAFIGATGSGKSTIINLMPRFFDTTEGEVFIDGINVKEYNLYDLNHKFGYVPQKGYLFHDSLVNNITIGKPDANATQIKRALDIAQASEFVQKLPNGIEYEISQGGKNVSGGQRQRLCIARAIITEPEIFIFDDSFSALDYKTDKVLRGEIKKNCPGVTNVIVAQRVGTIIDADQIIVLDYGKIVGQGKHKDLLKTCDVYREIAVSQLGEEEVANACK